MSLTSLLQKGSKDKRAAQLQSGSSFSAPFERLVTNEEAMEDESETDSEDEYLHDYEEK